MTATHPRHLADVGYCWDGQAVNGQEALSPFGMGQGTRWFGLRRTCCMFHPHTPLIMELLSDMEEVVCEISKWDFVKVDTGSKGLGDPIGMHHDGRIERKCEEAANVARLSRDFPNIVATYDDDLLGGIKTFDTTAEDYRAVPAAAKDINPALKHWCVVYTHELKQDQWKPFLPSMDVISLWVWNSQDIADLERHMDECRRIFPGKPILMGCYLRDYTTLAGVPMDRLKRQWDLVARWVADGTIAGYTIIGGCVLALQQKEARWVRDFIRAH